MSLHIEEGREFTETFSALAWSAASVSVIERMPSATQNGMYRMRATRCTHSDQPSGLRGLR